MVKNKNCNKIEKNKIEEIVIIGNGFNVAHRLKTTFGNFFHYLKGKEIDFNACSCKCRIKVNAQELLKKVFFFTSENDDNDPWMFYRWKDFEEKLKIIHDKNLISYFKECKLIKKENNDKLEKIKEFLNKQIEDWIKKMENEWLKEWKEKYPKLENDNIFKKSNKKIYINFGWTKKILKKKYKINPQNIINISNFGHDGNYKDIDWYYSMQTKQDKENFIYYEQNKTQFQKEEKYYSELNGKINWDNIKKISILGYSFYDLFFLEEIKKNIQKESNIENIIIYDYKEYSLEFRNNFKKILDLENISFEDLKIYFPDKEYYKNLIIIGNGLDLELDMKTSFKNFLDFLENNNNNNKNKKKYQVKDKALIEYLKILFPKLNKKNEWNNFEKNLSEMKIDNFLEKNFNNYYKEVNKKYDIEKLSIENRERFLLMILNFFEILDITNDLKSIYKKIVSSISEWLKEESLKFYNKKNKEGEKDLNYIHNKKYESFFYNEIFKDNSCSECKNFYINFNFTKTLSEIYGIKEEKIHYIHNKISYTNENNVISGEKLKIMIGFGEISKNPFKNIDIFVKDYNLIESKLNEKFKPYFIWEKLIFFGHSMGESDWKILDYLWEKISVKKWVIYYYCVSDLENIWSWIVRKINLLDKKQKINVNSNIIIKAQNREIEIINSHIKK